MVVVWRDKLTPANIGSIPTVIRAVSGGRPASAGVFVVIGTSVDAPDAATRDALAKGMKSVEGLTKCVAQVLEGEGFKAAAVRSVAVGLNLLVKSIYPLKAFATVDEGARWFTKQMSQGRVVPLAPGNFTLGLSELRASMADLRSLPDKLPR